MYKSVPCVILFTFSLCFPLKVLFILIIIQYQPLVVGSYHYPTWGTAVGWIITCSSIVPIPGYMIYRFCRLKGGWRKVISSNATCRDSMNTNLGLDLLILHNKLLSHLLTRLQNLSTMGTLL